MNRLPTIIRLILASATAVVMVLSGIAVAQTSSGEVTIAGFDLLSSKRVGRTTFEYEYGVNVQNSTSTDITDVSVTVSSSTTGVTVIDDSATIGAIASGTTATSGDTITVEVDRRVRFNPIDLGVMLNYEQIDPGVVEISDSRLDGLTFSYPSFGQPTYIVIEKISDQKMVVPVLAESLVPEYNGAFTEQIVFHFEDNSNNLTIEEWLVSTHGIGTRILGSDVYQKQILDNQAIAYIAQKNLPDEVINAGPISRIVLISPSGSTFATVDFSHENDWPRIIPDPDQRLELLTEVAASIQF